MDNLSVLKSDVLYGFTFISAPYIYRNGFELLGFGYKKRIPMTKYSDSDSVPYNAYSVHPYWDISQILYRKVFVLQTKLWIPPFQWIISQLSSLFLAGEMKQKPCGACFVGHPVVEIDVWPNDLAQKTSLLVTGCHVMGERQSDQELFSLFEG